MGTFESSRRGFRRNRVWVAVALSVILPGLGHLYIGRYRRAALWSSPVALILAGAVLAARSGTTVLVGAALSPSVLWGLLGVNVLAAFWRLGAALDASAIVTPRGAASTNRFLIVGGWFVVGLVLLTPHTVVGRFTVDALVLVDAVFVLEGEGAPSEPIIPIGSDADVVPDPAITIPPTTTTTTVPTPAGILTPPSADKVAPRIVEVAASEPYVDEVLRYLEGDPDSQAALRDEIFGSGLGEVRAGVAWKMIAGQPPKTRIQSPVLASDGSVTSDRITILLAGGDAGPGRGGLRTDTMMVATLDPATGLSALFGFPRNLGHTPLPSRFENAFTELQQRLAPPDTAVGNCKCFPEQLNALYPFTRKWTKSYPDEIDPGMAMLRDTLQNLMGIPIDYYVLADMAAFVDLVDAINGVDVYVQKPLVAEVSPPREGDPWAKVDVDVGWNHLDGPQALAYARARKGSSDYVRMQRQRCMVRAVAAKAEPLTLLRSFTAIVDAVESSVVTNIPLSQAPDLLTAAAKLDFSDIETVGFVHGYWEEERDHLGHPIPNVSRIRHKVASVIEGEPAETEDEVVASECDA